MTEESLKPDTKTTKATEATEATKAREGGKRSAKNDQKPVDIEEVDIELDKTKVDFTKGGVENFKFYPDNPVNHRHKYNWTMKEPSKFYDPCEESRQASINCVLRNQDDKWVCQEFFDAYRECKRDFFNNKKKEKRQGKSGWGYW